LLRKVGNCQFHGALNGDTSNAFVLVDPSVRRQLLFGFLTQGFQFFHALFCPRFLVITSPRRRADYRKHKDAEQCEEKHDPQPCGQRSARMCNLANRFGVGHFS
jgi:hypothetical protein